MAEVLLIAHGEPHSDMDNYEAEFGPMVQGIRGIGTLILQQPALRAQAQERQARAGLLDAQTKTEGFQQEHYAAGSGKLRSETAGQDMENAGRGQLAEAFKKYVHPSADGKTAVVDMEGLGQLLGSSALSAKDPSKMDPSMIGSFADTHPEEPNQGQMMQALVSRGKMPTKATATTPEAQDQIAQRDATIAEKLAQSKPRPAGFNAPARADLAEFHTILSGIAAIERKQRDILSKPQNEQSAMVLRTMRQQKDTLTSSLEAIRQRMGSGAAAPAVGGTVDNSGSVKPLTADKAQEFLRQSGGNKDAARKLAREAGYAF